MRLLLLISTIAISATCLTHSVSALAANKQSHASGRLLHGHSKHRLAALKLKDVGDVWKRIGASLRLPRPEVELALLSAQIGSHTVSPLPKKSDDQTEALAIEPPHEANKLSATISPESAAEAASASVGEPRTADDKSSHWLTPTTARLPKNNYTALGRKILGKMTENASGDCNPVKNNLAEFGASQMIKTRIRTQFNFHPELQKHTALDGRPVGYQERFGRSRLKKTPCSDNKFQKLAAHLMPASPVAEQLSAQDIQAQMQVLADKQKTLGDNADVNAPSSAAFDAQMQALAFKQRELEQQRSAKLTLNNERVNKFVNWYAQRRDYLYEVAERAKPYLYHIVERLNTEHLPLDLALLPIVESAYQATAKSPMSAAGLWQFIPSTGADYHLKQDAQYDDRLDIAASTQAATSYLSFLNQRFKGDWLLALAAYNCGIGRVEEAINRNVAAGLATDYWSLQLPEETQEYVPRLLALTTLFANPANYNIKLAPVKNEPYFVTVTLDHKLDVKHLADKNIKTIAELANINYAQFSLLNPGYLGSFLPSDRPLSFLMPIANANQLHQHLTMLAAIETGEHAHLQASTSVASVLNTPVIPESSVFSLPLLSLNVDAKTSSLTLPKPEVVTKKTDHQPRSAKEPYLTTHYVDRGETLQTVAGAFNVTVDELRKLNKFKNKQRAVFGQRLMIPSKRISTIMLATK
ncbi:MAG: transglycosylase SLT domain-containing protein [Methylococcaceae bacterium]|nr:transglycosylase SLT domain-containing protein [Methylococcaceae bacterium]